MDLTYTSIQGLNSRSGQDLWALILNGRISVRHMDALLPQTLFDGLTLFQRNPAQTEKSLTKHKTKTNIHTSEEIKRAINQILKT